MILVFVFKVDGVIKTTGLPAGETDPTGIIPEGIQYFVFDKSELPSYPPEVWDLSDTGVVSINHEKLAQYNRENMPTLTPIEFDIKLNNAGLYDAVQELIQSDIKLKIAYTRATFFSRTDPFIDQARIALGLTDEQVDEMWSS